ncbi:diaminopimelate epimerase [Candidatus Carsonella ruddii CS isolate Thao2000]|uniref:Diaminopimelate epimerase n=1 Tax=Candidatus Carsonella ruddii CS isolate Thao2000 TaxID=1202537 RepID=J7GWL2_CARRU|nr:diaminopimelate epimerase [Candidatus Carsonella ruddii]AFP83851.1 diaminopimelate epimerase [Candidatus Carsonella ruddii CS isolate Thao2000]
MNKFLKLNSLGNDFLFFFKKIKKINLFKFCNKKSGILCDQIFLIKKILFYNKIINIKIFNNDFSKAFNCGNGIRCLTWYFCKKKIKKIIKIKIRQNYVFSWEKNNNIYNIYNFFLNKNYLIIKIKKIFLKVFFINIGNNHIVLIIKNLNSFYLNIIEKVLRIFFCNKINIEFIKIINKNELFLRIFEKGVNETLSCGSGILSSFYILKNINFNKILKINSLGGSCIVKKKLFLFLIKTNVNFCCKGYI